MLNKQALDFSFASGLDTKTDPKRVQFGNFLQLQNSVFNKGGLLQKRNGYGQVSTLPSTSYSYLTTFKNNLTALGTNIAVYNNSNASWYSRGNIQSLNLSTIPLVRNNFNQNQCDSVVAPNGLVCTVYLEQQNAQANTATVAKYVIADSITNQNIVAPSVIPVASGTVTGGLRVFYLGTNFIIVFTNVISATSHLQYVAINSYSPSIISSNTDIAASYIPADTLSWDGVVANEKLYIAYNTTSGGQAVDMKSLTSTLFLSSAITFSSYTATMMSLCADMTTTTPTIYGSFYNSGSSTGFTFATDSNLNVIMNPVRIISTGTILNITSVAQNGTCSIFYEVSNTYSYDSNLFNNYIASKTVTPIITTFHSIFSSGAGTITTSSATGLSNGMYLIDNTTSANIASGTTFTISGTTLTLSINTAGNSASSPGDSLTAATISSQSIIIRSVGLGSKAFLINGNIYFLSSYQSQFQPSYFLINGSSSLSSAPVITAKLAYQNGGNYLAFGLPSVTVSNSTAYISYLFKDLIESINKSITPAQIGGIYSQTGINLAQFNFGTDSLDTAEIGNDLHISGGFLSMWDGFQYVEHNFFVYPDYIEAAAQSDPAPTGNTSGSSPILTSVSSVAGIAVGMTVTGTGIAANSVVISVGTTTVTMNKNGTGAHSGVVLTFTGNQSNQQYYYQVTYEWTDNQGNAFRSAPSIPVTATTSSGNSSVVINIPTLRLTEKTQNPVKIVIYRWSTGQQEFYQTTSILSPIINDTTIDAVQYIDVNSDSTILGNNLIYTTGGVIENINAPGSNIIALFDTRLWLVDAEDPNLLWYSKQVIENTPVEMNDLFTIYIPPTISTEGSTGPITALYPLDDKLIIAKANSILYINGTGPDNTGANNQYSEPTFITGTVGCSNQRSLVLTPNGLMFQSNKGIWLLDRGLNTTYIGAPVEDFTINSIVNSAINVPGTNQIRFTLDTGITLMYDYYYNQWGTFIGIPAVSSCIYQNLHTIINSNGITYQETPGFYLDGSNPVLMMFKTGPLRLGDLQNYQRAYFFYILGTYISPHKLQVNLTYDYETAPSQSILINPTNYSAPYGSGSSQSPYGQGNPYGGGTNLESWRVFLERQRCMAFGIQIQEIFDPSFGTQAGGGLTISGLNIVMGFKKGFRPQSAANTAG